MSTSNLIDNHLAKRLAIINSLVPAALLSWDAWHGQLGVNEVNFAIRTTGLIGLILLTASLAITPLRKLTGWNQLIAIRRNLGVIGFVYIAAHFAIFFWWDRSHDLGSTFNEIIERVYLWFGTAALILMIPLAITSTDAMVSRLGARRWKLLHRLAYLIVIAGVLHYYLLVKSDTRPPLIFAAILAIALIYRIVAHYFGLRHELTTARQKLAAARATAGQPRQRAFWSGELRIARIFDETGDVKTFRLVSPDGGLLPFQHIAGQYINLHLTIDGRRVNRSYTIASAPTRNAYCEISVKRAGYGSTHLHTSWREGALVKVSAPAGKFHFAGDRGDRIVLVAGGIGITPMMSVLRSLTDRGWPGQIYLIYSVKKLADIVFRDELAYLQSRFANLHVEITVTSDPEAAWSGARGQISRALIERAIPGLTSGPIMLCGPDPMMTAMRGLFTSIGIPDADIHQEAFLSPPASEAADDDTPAADTAPSGPADITFARAGKTAASTALTVLEAAEDCGIAIPYECRSGICGQCKTRLVSGKVAMDTQDALTRADRAHGLILACQARPAGNIVVDA